jgi:hypothetical protein
MSYILHVITAAFALYETKFLDQASVALFSLLYISKGIAVRESSTRHAGPPLEKMRSGGTDPARVL